MHWRQSRFVSCLCVKSDFRKSFDAVRSIFNVTSIKANVSAIKRLSTMTYGSRAALLIVLLIASFTHARAQSQSAIDGTTPRGIAPGTPAGSYLISNVESVDLYGGKPNVVVPIVHVGGRGTAGYTIVAPVSQSTSTWVTDFRSLCTPCNDPGYTNVVDAKRGPTQVWSSLPKYAPGVLAQRTTLLGPVNTSPIYPDGPPTQWGVGTTMIVFSSSDGTEHMLWDEITGGNPSQLSYTTNGWVYSPDPLRGRVFSARDGSGMTFISDSDLEVEGILGFGDSNDSPTRENPATGFLKTSDGTVYRFVYGQAQWMRDRNGNEITFTYTSGKLSKVSDPLGREVNISYGATADDITYTGFGGLPRTITVSYGSLSNNLRPNSGYQTGTIGSLFPAYSNWGFNNAGDVVNPSVLSIITLPDGRNWRFYYNPYVELARVEAPTGAATEYDYWVGVEGNQTEQGAAVYPSGQIGAIPPYPYQNPSIAIYRRLKERREFANGGSVWTSKTVYGRFSSISAPKIQVDQIDKDNVTVLARTIHYFSGYAYHNLFTSYSLGYPGFVSDGDLEGKEIKTESLNVSSNVVLSRSESSWSGAVCFARSTCSSPNHWSPQLSSTKSSMLDGSTGQYLISKKDFSYDIFDNLIDTYEHRFGVNQEGSLARHSHTDFVTTNNSIDYTSTEVFLRSLPLRQWLKGYDPNTGQELQSYASYTEFLYDESAYPVMPVGQVSGWVDVGAAPRGMATTVKRWLNFPASSYLYTHARYDQFGNVKEIRDAKGALTQIDYASTSAYAFPTTVTSAVPDSGGVYASQHSLVTETAYDFPTGLVTSVRDANQQTTTADYTGDALDRLKQVTGPDGARVRYNYFDSPGNLYLQVLTDEDASRSIETRKYFDGLGRPTRVFLYDGTAGTPWTVTDTYYDSLGRVSQVSNPYRTSAVSGNLPSTCSVCASTAYDELSRVKTMTTADGAHVSTDYAANTNSNAPLVTIVTVADQKNRQRRSLTDSLGQLIRVDEPVAQNPSDQIGVLGDVSSPNQPTSYSYDILGNLRSVTQATQQVSQQRFFMYDSLSRLIRARNPEEVVNANLTLTDAVSGNGQWCMSYAYDGNGNLTTRVDARDITTTYAYDALNRNTGVTYANDPANTPAVVRTYDNPATGAMGLSRPWKTETAGAQASRTIVDAYDPLGRALEQRQQFFSEDAWGQSFSVSRTYDRAGHVKTQTYPSGHSVSYDYDSAGRMNKFAGNLGDGEQHTYASEFKYTEFGTIQQERFGTLTPLYHKQKYNERGQLWDMRLSTVPFDTDATNGDRGAIANFYSDNFIVGASGDDNNGNLRRQEIRLPGSVFFQDTFSYDELNRLTSISEKLNGTNSNTFKQTYQYDRWGNRKIDQAESSGTGINHLVSEVDPQTNRLSSVEGNPATYDASGNLISDGQTFTGTVVPTYDAENRLSLIEKRGPRLTGSPGYVAAYSYDGDGHRVRRRTNLTILQIYGMDGELLAEYQDGGISSIQLLPGIPATNFLPQTEYGYRGGQLLVTARSGDNERVDRFIKNFYYASFGREPEGEELTTQRDALLAAGIDGEAQLLTSAVALGQQLFDVENPWGEYNQRQRTDTQFVTDLYFAYLQRPPESSGLAYYVLQLQQGVSREAMRDAFGNSHTVEFAAIVSTLHGTNNNLSDRVTHYLWSIYFAVPGGTSNFNGHLASLQAAAAESRSEAINAARTVGINRFQPWITDTSKTDQQFAVALFNAFLQREPSEDEVSTWVATIQSEGRSQALQSFASLPASGELAGTLYREILWLVPDQLGTPRMISERSGSLTGIKRRDYLPFGEEVPASFRNGFSGYNATDTLRQKYTSSERDIETGLDYFLARYYSSTQGRFTSPDEFTGGPDELFVQTADSKKQALPYAEITQPQSLNKYAYVYNNPCRYTDPDGHCGTPSGLRPGQVGICVASYIKDRLVWGGAPTPGRGDGRGPNGQGGTSRVEVRVIVDAKGNVTKTDETMGRSGLFFKGAGPKGTGGSDVSSPNKDEKGNIYFQIHQVGTSSTPAGWIGDIESHLNMVVTPDQKVGITPSSTAKDYPSLEVYKYTMDDKGNITTTLIRNKADTGNVWFLMNKEKPIKADPQ